MEKYRWLHLEIYMFHWIRLLYMLAHAYNIIIGCDVGAIFHGRAVVDYTNVMDTNFLFNVNLENAKALYNKGYEN